VIANQLFFSHQRWYEKSESFAAVVLDKLLSGTDIDIPRLIVDVLSTTAEPASCWFHHKKATPPEPRSCLVMNIFGLFEQLHTKYSFSIACLKNHKQEVIETILKKENVFLLFSAAMKKVWCIFCYHCCWPWQGLTNILVEGGPIKTAQSLWHHNFVNVRHRGMRFSAKCCKRNS